MGRLSILCFRKNTVNLQQMIQMSILKTDASQFRTTGGTHTVTFRMEQLEHYTQLIILHACEEAINLEGRNLDD